jgi:hypothetical protein
MTMTTTYIDIMYIKKSKILRIPHCLDNRLIDGGKVVNPTHLPHFTPQKHFFFLMFPVLISVTQTPGRSAAGRIRKI